MPSKSNSNNTLIETTVTDMPSPPKHTTPSPFTNDYHKDMTVSEIIDFSDVVFETEILADQLPSVVAIDRPLMDYRNQFNECEGSRLQELLSGTSVYVELSQLPFPLANRIDGHRLYDAIANKFARFVLTLTQMCRKLSAFNQLCENDRISLVKYGSFDLYILRSIPFFDTGANSWTFILVGILDNELGIKVTICLDELKNGKRNVHTLTKIFIRNMSREWDSDLVLLDLLTR
ncbi:unnamed protein product [Oppiella nova]|uniref:Uncharacterized protein n=1 Tax=Oppiella nova TaxID=334625 RepID=A0A7R9M5N2_9ACAR|nr:unnamed protein product [Oppiella nova]CAG2169946.1 unnamed protein product [Oppiella nova]